MFGAVIRALIFLCFLALGFYLIVWVIGELGIMLPAMVVHIIGIIFVLFAIYVLYLLLAPYLSGFDWLGRRGPPPAVIILAAIGACMLLAAPAAASNCWYTPMGVACAPG